MRKRLMLVGIGAVIAVCLGASAGASAATQVGDPCFANLLAETTPTTVFSISVPQSPIPAAVPAAGVITNWGINISPALSPGLPVPTTFKVLRPDWAAKSVQVVAEDSEVVTLGTSSFSARVPVHAGDVVAAYDGNGRVLACEEPSPGAVLGGIPGNPTIGQTVPFVEQSGVGRLPLLATVEPDADGDGYGDETQDKCPTDASTQGPCPPPMAAPAPPAPITLSASAAAKKTFLTVSLTTTAQASVTVTGTVKIGKGKTVKLSGNTQTVALGALAKFTVLFPAKLKAALKQLPTSKKLTINLSASAPGATTKTLTVKVPGQKRPRRAGAHEQHHLM